MKRFLFVGFVALGLTAATRSAKADCAFEYSCSRHFSFVHTSKNRCFNFSSHSNPLPCLGGHCGSGGPALWDGFAGYPAPPYAAPVAAAPAAAAPAAPAPAAKTPSFNAPQPKENANGVQQTGYSYYGQTANPGYNAGYTYGGYSYYGYGTGPNYWYDN